MKVKLVVSDSSIEEIELTHGAAHMLLLCIQDPDARIECTNKGYQDSRIGLCYHIDDNEEVTVYDYNANKTYNFTMTSDFKKICITSKNNSTVKQKNIESLNIAIVNYIAPSSVTFLIKNSFSNTAK